jgi:hypothetical protein
MLLVGISEMKLLVNSVAGSHPVTHIINVKIAGVRNIPPALHSTLSRSAIEATAEIVDRLLLESLILAQDERWRRA